MPFLMAIFGGLMIAGGGDAIDKPHEFGPALVVMSFGLVLVIIAAILYLFGYGDD